MGNGASSAQGGAKPALAPRAVKFGLPAELGPVIGACYSRTGATAEKPPVVVAASADALDQFNGLTGVQSSVITTLTVVFIVSSGRIRIFKVGAIILRLCSR